MTLFDARGNYTTRHARKNFVPITATAQFAN